MNLDQYFEEICQIAREVLAQHETDLDRVGLTASTPNVRTIQGFKEPELLVEFYRDGNLEDVIERFTLENRQDPIPLNWWRDCLRSDLLDVIAQASNDKT